MADLLNVADIRRRTRANGPGWRSAVWVQGCTIRCPGCFNAHTHPHVARNLHDPEDLAVRLWADGQGGATPIEGLTLLGGEPFEQAAACARFARRARELGASVVTYSGYTAACLMRSGVAEVQDLLAATDLLIAGPFVQRQTNDGRGWHGSVNQELVYLTGRYSEAVLAQVDEAPVLEARVDGTRAEWTGIPARGDLGVVGG